MLALEQKSRVYLRLHLVDGDACFCLYFHNQPEAATEPSSTMVPFLQKYADIRNKKTSVSFITLSQRDKLQNCIQVFVSEKHLVRLDMSQIHLMGLKDS